MHLGLSPLSIGQTRALQTMLHALRFPGLSSSDSQHDGAESVQQLDSPSPCFHEHQFVIPFQFLGLLFEAQEKNISSTVEELSGM